MTREQSPNTNVRHRRAFGVAAAAAVAAAAMVVTTTVSAHHAPLVGASQTGPSSSVGPAPPRGTRWAGIGRVVVAVPSTWADSQYGCETDPRPSLVYDAYYWLSCQDTRLGEQRRLAALWVMRAPHRPPVAHFRRRATIAIPRLSARRSPPWRENGPDGRYWYESLVVPSDHTTLVAQARAMTTVTRIIGSARLIPRSAAVPPLVAGERLVAARAALAGHRVLVRHVAGVYRTGHVIGADPAFGSPLGRNTPVTLAVSSGLGLRQSISHRAFLRLHFLVQHPGPYPAEVAHKISASRRTIEAKIASTPGPWDSQLVLRRVTGLSYRRQGPPFFHHRLVWLVLRPRVWSVSMGPPAPLVVERGVDFYDALTGKWLEGMEF